MIPGPEITGYSAKLEATLYRLETVGTGLEALSL